MQNLTSLPPFLCRHYDTALSYKMTYYFSPQEPRLIYCTGQTAFNEQAAVQYFVLSLLHNMPLGLISSMLMKSCYEDKSIHFLMGFSV